MNRQWKTIEIEIDGRGVARLWLNRPETHNAMSPEMLTELTEAATWLDAEESVRVVVLGGRGRSFCAGGDLRWMKAQMGMEPATRARESARIADALLALDRMGRPLVGRIHGNAFGGGVGLACVCDVTVGSTTVRMGLTETRLGLIPANIGPYVAARVGAGRARGIFSSGRILEAAEAHRLDILSRVVAPEALDAAVEEEIAPWLACAPGAVAEAKALLRSFATPAVDQAVIARTVEALARRWETDEAAEGIAAFLERRKPDWAR